MFATIKDATAESNYEVTTVKNDKGYLDWTSVTKGDGPSTTASPRQGNVSAPRSNYETPEERAARQVLIVKQSSLAQAVAFTKDADADVNEVLVIAEQFKDWIFDNNNVKTEELNDIPF